MVLIPVNEPWLGDAERALAGQALAAGWISGHGEFIDRFEASWSGVCRRRHGIAVSNGSAALETAIHALDLPAGSEVILPTFTLISCAAAVLRGSLVPVFVDADPRTWCMDVRQLESFVTERTAGLMAVHIYGHPVEMGPLLELAARRDLRVVEDAAEAHGARYRGRVCGSFGDVSTFSFYSSKIVTTGEGGMVLCDRDDLAERCRSYRNLYFGRRERFLHDSLGQNFRFNNLQAAIGCAQIDKLGRSLDRKARMGALYTELLRDVPDLQLPAVPEDGTNVFWVYGVVLGDSYRFDAAELQRRLHETGVETRPFFRGLHEQPALRERGFGQRGRFPVAERLARRGLYLPSGLTLDEEQIHTVVRKLRACLGH